jgi:hypothetical protein
VAKANSVKQARISKEVAIPRRRSRPGHRKVSKRLLAKMRQARNLLWLLCCLVVADAVISNFIVRSGFGTEGNPFIQSIVGQTSFIFLKLSAAFFSSLILWQVFSHHRRIGLASIILFVMLFTAILWWNLGIWFIAQHNIPV